MQVGASLHGPAAADFSARPDTCTSEGMDIRGLALGSMVAAAVAACTTPEKCVDGTCRPVAGEYTFVFDPPMACDSWDSSKVSPAPLHVEAQAAALTIVLWPFGPNPHTFTG